MALQAPTSLGGGGVVLMASMWGTYCCQPVEPPNELVEGMQIGSYGLNGLVAVLRPYRLNVLHPRYSVVGAPRIELGLRSFTAKT